MASFPVAGDGFQSFLSAAVNVDVYQAKTSNRGVDITLSHNVPTRDDAALLWAQTVAENGSFAVACKKAFYVDPAGFSDASGKIVCKPDDSLPFYYTDAERGGAKDDPDFVDGPSEPPPSKGGTWIRFVTSLTQVTGGKDVLLLVSVVWGFDIFANGKFNVTPIRLAKAFEQNGHAHILKREFPDYTFRTSAF
jgi:hypothetical protein